MFQVKGKYTDATIMIDNIEPECLTQIVNMTNNIAFSNPIVIMPDTHAGKGSVIGFTMKIGDKIIPNIVGVDIGCGMLSFKIGKIKLDHIKLDKDIRKKIPFGMNVRANSDLRNKEIKSKIDIVDLCKRIGMDYNYAINSIGTLGGGNHFIEIGVDDNDETWITIHTGSRNLGKKVCEYWQGIATKKSVNNGMSFNDGVEEIKRKYPKSQWNGEIANLRNKIKMTQIRATGLEYLEGEDLEGYINDMYLAQDYAKLNRQTIFEEILKLLPIEEVVPKLKIIETVHNYISPIDRIIRKGAIASYNTIDVVIPFNMKDGLIIGRGKSNSEWNFSAPHGAGRVLSRASAKKLLNVDDFKNDMKDVFSTSVGVGTLDESPRVYKDADVIREAIKPTVDVILNVRPIHNMKAEESCD